MYHRWFTEVEWDGRRKNKSPDRGCVTILALFRVYHFHKDSRRAREIYLLWVS